MRQRRIIQRGERYGGYPDKQHPRNCTKSPKLVVFRHKIYVRFFTLSDIGGENQKQPAKLSSRRVPQTFVYEQRRLRERQSDRLWLATNLGGETECRQSAIKTRKQTFNEYKALDCLLWYKSACFHESPCAKPTDNIVDLKALHVNCTFGAGGIIPTHCG